MTRDFGSNVLPTPKNRDTYLSFDAYRTQYGMSKNAFAGVIVGITIGASLLLALSACSSCIWVTR